ncbi:MAG: hypothetical protein Q8O56_01955 [Solirubrobacteraceae bacterium]|nr:hypothetical protein [Solirubrobacteraceae bacterium]
MRTTYGPPQVAAYELRPGERLICWRIVRSEHRDDPVLLSSLRSNFELGLGPRAAERTSRLIHLGVSAYLNEQSAHETAEKFHKLGDWVARLEMEHGNGFNYAHTGSRWHLTIWGDAIKLSDSVVDISPARA